MNATTNRPPALTGVCLYRAQRNDMAPRIRSGDLFAAEHGVAPVIGQDVLIELTDGNRLVRELAELTDSAVRVVDCWGNNARTIAWAEIVCMAPVIATKVSPDALEEPGDQSGAASANRQRWLISSQSGSVFGVFNGATKQEAFEAMVADSGSVGPTDTDGNPTVGTASDWIIDEIEPGSVVLDGRIVDMAAVRALMDDALCEAIHGTVHDDQEFTDAYLVAHRRKYGAEFAFN